MANKAQKTFFMLRKFWKDIHQDREIYQLSDDVHGPELGDYYFLMTEEQLLAGHSQQFHFDDEGIPVIPTYIDVAERRLIYYPISIGQYGLAIWHTYLRSNSEEDRRRFLKIADWFYRNGRKEKDGSVSWLTEVTKPAYRIAGPWRSAFSQARAMNILLRAHQISGKREYEACATAALPAFRRPVSGGGVTVFLEEGPFYEEYPAAVPVLVLNGMIFALCGVYDFVRTHPGHALSREIFDEGVETLLRLLPRYDLGFWSRYSLCEADFHPEIDPATIGYHYLHIVQLKLMFQLTGREKFQEYARRWESYINLSNILKMYKLKYSALRKMNRL